MVTSERALILHQRHLVRSEDQNQMDTQQMAMRGYLLFWDRLLLLRDKPARNMRNFSALRNIGALKDVKLRGATTRWCGQTHEREDATYDELLLQAFEEMEEQEPGVWSIASHPNDTDRKIFTAPGRAILAKLYTCIPVPTRDVPWDDVLEFKNRRRPEQLALRHSIERVYQGVIAAGDGPLALKTEGEALTSAIEDLLAVTEEAAFAFRFCGIEARLKAEFDVGQAMHDGTIAASALGAGLSSLAAAAAGAFAGVVKNVPLRLELSSAAGTKSPRVSNTPYEYVLLMHREF